MAKALLDPRLCLKRNESEDEREAHAWRAVAYPRCEDSEVQPPERPKPLSARLSWCAVPRRNETVFQPAPKTYRPFRQRSKPRVSQHQSTSPQLSMHREREV